MNCSHRDLPGVLSDEVALDDLLSEPTDALIETLRQLDGDLLLLGAGGKLGLSMARMAHRALQESDASRSVTAVSRFSDAKVRTRLEAAGVRTHRADLFQPAQVAELPDAALIVFLVGRKFGTSGDEPRTWATNVSLPTMVCQRFHSSRIVALSTLCVYPFVTPASGGSRESDRPQPVGEYAMSTLGRERVFEHFSATQGTRTAIVRLTYAVEMRYGVLVDIGRRVWAGEPVNLSTAYLNLLWQADANARILTALEYARSPASVLNVAGPDVLSVKEIATSFGERMQRTPQFIGQPESDAWLPAASRIAALAEPPRVMNSLLIDWTADWIARGQPFYDKPTRFEVRDGTF